jgi:hypothetical protein
MSHLQIRRSWLTLAPKWLECGGGRALAGGLMQSTNQKRLGCDVTMGTHHWYARQASQWKMVEEGAPALCGSFLS